MSAPWPRLDLTVSFGNILIVLSILLSAVGLYTTTMVRMSALELRLVQVEGVKGQLSQIILDLSVVQKDVAVIKDRMEFKR